MLVTDTQFLPYPEGDDPANAPLQLQLLAEAVNDKLVAQTAALEALADRQVRILRRNTNLTGLAANTNTVVTFDQNLYDSTGGVGTSTGYATSDDTPSVYMIGAYLVTNPSGAVTGNSVRRLLIQTNTFVGPGPSDFRALTVSTENYESSQGGEHQFIQMMVRVENPVLSDFNILFNHGNAGSTINVIAGSLCWMYRVGDLEV